MRIVLLLGGPGRPSLEVSIYGSGVWSVEVLSSFFHVGGTYHNIIGTYLRMVLSRAINLGVEETGVRPSLRRSPTPRRA